MLHIDGRNASQKAMGIYIKYVIYLTLTHSTTATWRSRKRAGPITPKSQDRNLELLLLLLSLITMLTHHRRLTSNACRVFALKCNDILSSQISLSLHNDIENKG
jgi:hypothetical protein